MARILIKPPINILILIFSPKIKNAVNIAINGTEKMNVLDLTGPILAEAII